MSEAQVQGSIISVANILFNRKEFGEWRLYEKREPTDVNTLPASTNINRTESYVEAMILSSIVEDVMNSNENGVITYSNDGSSLSGTGSFVVQSFTINGKKRALPTLGVFTESKESLAELEIATLRILSASVGHKYSAKDIMTKIDFVITDSTAHNIGVVNQVCAELGVAEDDIPSSLVYHVHLLMMFQSKVKEVYQSIHDGIGDNRIKDCFLVDIDFKNESFIYKSIRCLTSFINSDFHRSLGIGKNILKTSYI